MVVKKFLTVTGSGVLVRAVRRIHLSVESLALIGNASADDSRDEDVRFRPRRFRSRRLEGSRWWVRRTRLWGKNAESTLES